MTRDVFIIDAVRTPIGVRTASMMNTSLVIGLLRPGVGCCRAGLAAAAIAGDRSMAATVCPRR